MPSISKCRMCLLRGAATTAGVAVLSAVGPAELAVRFTDCVQGGDGGCRTEFSHSFDVDNNAGTAIYQGR